MDKIILQSLASDLKRVALSIQRNSPTTASRFQKEAIKWLRESEALSKKYESSGSIPKLLKKIELCLRKNNDLEKAEDLLMYSTLIQNRSLVL